MLEILLELMIEGYKKSFKTKLILDVGLLIYFLSTFIFSIVRFAIKQDPLVYNIVCNSVTFIGLVIGSCTLACKLYKCCTKVKHKIIRVRPENYDDNEDEDIDTLKELALDILKEIFIYPAVICSLYGFINERSWQFDNALRGVHFLMFLFSLFYDTLYTKLKYIWAMRKVILCCDKSDESECTMKCCLSIFLLIPHLFLFILVHWLTLAIIGTRIYIDNFSTKLDQGNTSETSGYPFESYRIYADNFTTGNVSETGGYEVAPYTAYMISCGIYLPVASVIVYIILSRGWFDDEIDSPCEQMFHFVYDPAAYIATIFLMVPFIAFCVGIYLPYYDSTVKVDANARDAAGILGMVFFLAFLLFNIKATVIFVIITVAVVIIVVIITVAVGIIASSDHHSCSCDYSCDHHSCSWDYNSDHNCGSLLWFNLSCM